MHNLKMYGGLLIVFLVGAGSAFQGGFTPANVITMLIAGLIAIEHNLNGASSTN